MYQRNQISQVCMLKIICIAHHFKAYADLLVSLALTHSSEEMSPQQELKCENIGFSGEYRRVYFFQLENR